MSVAVRNGTPGIAVRKPPGGDFWNSGASKSRVVTGCLEVGEIITLRRTVVIKDVEVFAGRWVEPLAVGRMNESFSICHFAPRVP